ncbi:hypothetical protein VYU27_008963 [Nannochloropsis oceanica]
MIATEGYESDSKNLASSSDEEKDDEYDLTCVDLGRQAQQPILSPGHISAAAEAAVAATAVKKNASHHRSCPTEEGRVG